MNGWMDDKRQSEVDNLPVRSVFGSVDFFCRLGRGAKNMGLSSSSTLVPWPIRRH
jgi:hypothetical protein